ncbi:DEAD/DEAH box helicase [Atopobacter phocae]|uniref:DEAD/DEAH box helicase n=1 Tax=Atopobacter phocae TaxID=136492 RepID=UPI00046FCD37|nr:DEAD/DEAH box helicase [Atopobacter phocae]
MSFTTYNLPPFILEAINHLNFKQPTPIQETVIPAILRGESIVAQSRTGSGKSHGFLLPLLGQVDPEQKETQLIITSPSRELSEQLYQMALSIEKFRDQPIVIDHLVGGSNKARQTELLKRRQPQVVIGTPGRIYDLIQNSGLDIHTAQHLVIDEADMTMDLGFLNTIDQIASRMPKNLKIYAFSATIPQQLFAFLKKYMENPTIFSLDQNEVTSTVTNYLLNTRSKNEIDLLHQVIQIGHPYLVLIFANTIERVDSIHYALEQRGLKVAKIHGNLENRERRRIMKRIRDLEFQYVVASDLASRGIDIPGVSHVINVDIPDELEFFIHRVGRTGRQGIEGTAITFYHPDLVPAIQALEKRGINFIEVQYQDEELVPTASRLNRRIRKKDKKVELEANTLGYIKKQKKRVKPGYKKKIKDKISDQRKRNNRLNKRHSK